MKHVALSGSAALAAAVSVAVAGGASAAPNLIVDGGFETPASTTPDQFQSGYVSYNPGQSFGGPGGDAWTVIGSGNDVTLTSTTEYTNGPTYYNGHSGLQWLDLTGAYDNGSAVGVAQTVSTTANAKYTLSFWVGTFIDAPSAADVQVDGVDLGTFTNPTAGVYGGDGDNWEQFSTSFVGTGSDTLSFIYAGGKSVDGLDDISLTAQGGIPEPAAWAMMLTGFGGVGAAMRSARRRRAVVA